LNLRDRGTAINYERLYQFRFRDVDTEARERVWKVIAKDLYERMGSPRTVLDPAAGSCEFIASVPSAERWAVDRVKHVAKDLPGVHFIVADIFSAELPVDYFDGVLVSNFLEHLPTQEAVADLLEKLARSMKTGARIAVMGPNFKYCAKEYFDCADHVLALSHLAVEEHLYAANLLPVYIKAKYLPYSFRGKLPPSPALTGVFLKLKAAQALLGKQFLVIAEKP
jgi:ubiquinone/menaquinone biosynthesis C-methylase UbiE